MPRFVLVFIASCVLTFAGCAIDTAAPDGRGDPTTATWDVSEHARLDSLGVEPVGGVVAVESSGGNNVRADIELPGGERLTGSWQLVTAVGEPHVTSVSATAETRDIEEARQLVAAFFERYGGDPTSALEYIDDVTADPANTPGRHFYGDTADRVTPHLRVDHRGESGAIMWFIDYTFDL